MLPERAYVFAAAKLPAGAATTGLMLVLLLLPVAARAQDAASVSPVQRSELKREMEGQLMCMCGGCRAPMNNCPMAPGCHGLKDQEPKLDAYIAQGMSRDAIKAAFVKEYGETVLLEPPDTSFNRLAWLFPYVVGGVGAGAIGLVGWRWSRKPDASQAESVQTMAVEDVAAKQRLDDELRDLD